jgi:acetylornithine/succinyldiaminopimelate/putrescine aminotransferase
MPRASTLDLQRPFASREATFEAFARHVSGGKVTAYRSYGLDAVMGQRGGALESLDIGNHHLVSGHRAMLARRLAATTHDRLEGIVFGVGGGEAMDVAIKVARAVTRREKIVSVIGGYHGHTGLALATGEPQYREPFGPNLPGFVQVSFNDLEAMDRAVDADTAAVVLEPIPATLGMAIPS